MKMAWCEQTGEFDTRQSLRDALSTLGMDYYRYNWRSALDEIANVDAPRGLSWSKGREALYRAASAKGYDYYIFCDDDISFVEDTEQSLRQIEAVLRRHVPAAAALGAENWHERFTAPLDRRKLLPVDRPFFLADMQVQILARRIADETFPCPFDGGWATLWYPNIAVGGFMGGAQIRIGSVEIRNERTTATGFYGGVPDDQLRSKILAQTFNDTLPSWLRHMVRALGLERAVQILNFVWAVRPLRRFEDGERISEYLRRISSNERA